MIENPMKNGKTIMMLRNPYLFWRRFGLFATAMTLAAMVQAGAETAGIAGQAQPPPKAKRITVSLLGPRPLYGVNLHGQAAVDHMIRHWEQELAWVLPDKPDLIVIPENCDLYPSHTIAEQKAYYDIRGDQIRDFFRRIAKANHCYVVYAAGRKMDDRSYRNSAQLIDRNGEIVGIYHKNHPVPHETTESGVLCGKDAPVFQTDFGRVALAICFDLNFHELLEKYAAQRPDLIIFSSMYHGGLMQDYWAYHCRSYFVGAVAGDECTVVNPLGRKIANSTNYYHHVTTTINLDGKVVHLDENWGKIQAAKLRYGQGLTVFDPGHVGAVLLTSEMPDRSAGDIIREFGIETWDEYYARSLKHRHTPGNMEK